jgi:8-oxo-dGTP pyrophosphatase MutT (NUDIX family)
MRVPLPRAVACAAPAPRLRPLAQLGETDEEALVRETDEEVGVAVADLVVDGRHVLLFAARRSGAARDAAAMEVGTHVRWERVDALDRVQPALPSLRASQEPGRSVRCGAVVLSL